MYAPYMIGTMPAFCCSSSVPAPLSGQGSTSHFGLTCLTARQLDTMLLVVPRSTTLFVLLQQSLSRPRLRVGKFTPGQLKMLDSKVVLKHTGLYPQGCIVLIVLLDIA